MTATPTEAAEGLSAEEAAARCYESSGAVLSRAERQGFKIGYRARSSEGKGEAALREVLKGLIAVRPSNWDDEEDEEQAAAWRAADTALSPRPVAGGAAHIADAGKMVAIRDREALLRLAQAYDEADAAMRGEPSPWRDLTLCLEDVKWAEERIACAKAALSALHGEGEAVAWLHVMHCELGQTMTKVSLSEDNPWGVAGENYSAEYSVTSTPLRPTLAAASLHGEG